MSDELKFIDGMNFASSGFIQQGFSGTSAQTSHFIAMLVGSGIWKVSVRFHNYREQKTVFRTVENSSKSITIIVNSGRDDFLLKDFGKYLTEHAFDVGYELVESAELVPNLLEESEQVIEPLGGIIKYTAYQPLSRERTIFP